MGSEYNLWTKSCPLASTKIERRQGGGENPKLQEISH